MIYLIGGPPRSGKTTEAKRLAAELKIPWLSTDTVENVLAAYTPAENLSRLFPHRTAWQRQNDEYFGTVGADTIVERYIVQAKTLSKAIETTVETVLEDGDDLILEGYHITPEVAAKLIRKFGKEKIKAMFFIRKDTVQLLQGFLGSQAHFDWVVHLTRKPETLQAIAEVLIRFGEFFEKEAQVHRLPLTLTDPGIDRH